MLVVGGGEEEIISTHSFIHVAEQKYGHGTGKATSTTTDRHTFYIPEKNNDGEGQHS